MIIWLILLAVGIGLLAGLYPALYLSSMVPLTALVATPHAGKRNLVFRELLVLAQFTISVGVIACTLIMGQQMRYIANKALGYDKENRVVVRLRGADTVEKLLTIRTELTKHSGILGVTASESVPGNIRLDNLFSIEDNGGEMASVNITHTAVADNFLEEMGMQLVAGRDFTRRLLTDVGLSVIVNEAMVRQMGWDEPIGKRMVVAAGGQPAQARVIGVVQDFHFRSLRTAVDSFVLRPFRDDFANLPPAARPNVNRVMIVRLAGENIRESLQFLEEKMTEFDPRHPFDFEFLDDSLNELYESETRLMTLMAIFAGICIFIACLGLYGLAAFTTEQRTREIGLRKVIGASTAQIIGMLAQRILLIVLAGSLIASTISWTLMDDWLAGFEYRTSINPGVFLVAAAAAAAVAFITVALQSFRTAQANPVNALRYE